MAGTILIPFQKVKDLKTELEKLYRSEIISMG